MKQSKLRRRRVVRYAVLYFVLFVIFVALIAGPVALKKVLKEGDLKKFYETVNLKGSIGPLMQPNFLKNDDTQASSDTGTGAASYTYPSGFGPTSSTGAPQATS